MTTVWLPEAGLVEMMGGMPAGMTADIWSGGERLPGTADEVQVIVLPFRLPQSRMPALAALPRLRLIQLVSAGAESVLPHVPPGVTLANARGVHDPSVAEWITAVILAQVRWLPRFMAAQAERTWDFALSEPLCGKTVLIVGYGSIGAVLERRLAPFEVTIERVARTPRPGIAGVGDLPSMLPRADIVVLLVPVTPATTGLVDSRFLALMRDNTLLVNAARGPVVDHGALLAELRSGRLRAALDVTVPEPLPADDPLWSAPGVMITPHVAGATSDASEVTMRFIKGQLARYAASTATRRARLLGTRARLR